jgi:hypothetical protein
MSKFPGSSIAKRNAPGASLMDGRQATQQCLLTDSETGSDSEKLDGEFECPKMRKGQFCWPFFMIF